MLLAVMLALAGALIVAGVAMWSVPAALVTAGVALAAWSLLFLLDVGDRDVDVDEQLGAGIGGAA